MTVRNKKIDLRWGILGTGWVAEKFVLDLITDAGATRDNKNIVHHVHAVGSSSGLQRAESFKVRVMGPESTTKAYGNYEELCSDPDFDVVFVATPTAFHFENCQLALDCGKHVVCEKPLCVNAMQARTLVQRARSLNLYFMEAMWIRFTPAIAKLKQLLFEDRVCGQIRRVFCDFAKIGNSDERKEDKVLLGKGTLLDIGVYTLNMAAIALPQTSASVEPQTLAAAQLYDDEAVDETISIIEQFPAQKATAILTASRSCRSQVDYFRAEGYNGATLLVKGPGASMPNQVVVQLPDGSEEVYDFPLQSGMGFYWEADAVARDLADGRLESTIMPHAESLRIMELMDRIRAQIGVRYPADDQA